MAWAYVHPGASAKDHVRYLIGDVDAARPVLQDEEIYVELSRTPAVPLAAIRCVEAILARMAPEIDRTITDFSASHSQKFTHYEKLLAHLRRRAARGAWLVVAGAESEPYLDRTDAALGQPAFTRGLV